MGDRSRTKGEDNDHPPMSRLFILLDKVYTEEDIRRGFEKYGKIESLWTVKSKTGERKGLAYVKYTKTSDAALAQEEMNGKRLVHGERPIRVVVAAKREEGSKRDTEEDNDKYLRLFVFVPKERTEEELTREFERYGPVDSVQIVRDKNTRKPKGIAYIKYHRFYNAALAYEKCPSKYKAVFAAPKQSRQNFETSSKQCYETSSKHSQQNFETSPKHSKQNYENPSKHSRHNFENSMRHGPRNETETSYHTHNARNMNSPDVSNEFLSLTVTCSNKVNQDQLWRLFDIVPGLDYCQINHDGGRFCIATVVYLKRESADYARRKMHGIEYPPGERVIVRYSDESTTTIPDNSMFNTYCNVKIPEPQPLANPNTEPVKKCFIVLSSYIPTNALKEVFSCFGNLIEVFTLKNRNCGFASYASADSATRAIEVLDGAEICGVRVKVMEAEEKQPDRKRMRYN